MVRMKKCLVLSKILLISLLLINCRSDKTHKISTITIERIEQNLPKQIDYHWHLVADPPPTHDLVVINGSEHQPDNWIDYDRKNWTSDVKHRSVPPYYVVIKKSKCHSQTYKTDIPKSVSLEGYKPNTLGETFPIYINPLPSVSIVGKGIRIDTDTLSQTLPATSYGGHIIPKGHTFVPYRVGKACGIDKDGNVITE